MIETIDTKARTASPLAAQMARLFAKALADATAPFDLAPAQFMVLRELWRADGLIQSDLARRLEVEQATMANTLKRMARDGLILRESHPDDSRAYRIRLTPHARLLEKPAKAAVKRVNARALANLSRKEQKRFVDLSRRVIGALKGESTGRRHEEFATPTRKASLADNERLAVIERMEQNQVVNLERGVSRREPGAERPSDMPRKLLTVVRKRARPLA